MTATAAQIAEQVRSGARTAVDVIRETLDTVTRLDPMLHFMDTLDAIGALAAAREFDVAQPLAGVPFLILAGVPFLIKAGTPAESPIIARLVAAGAIPIGTSTRAHSQAVSQTCGWNGTNYTRNPWNTDRSPGGSSAGAAAAVAAGVVPIATGGDSAGSLRIPAAYCGGIGLKGTAGRVPRPTGQTLGHLTVPGIIGTDLDDVVAATSIVSGPDRLDPSALPHWPVPHRSPPHGSPPHGSPPHGSPPHGSPPHGSPLERPSPARSAGHWRVAYRSTLGGARADTSVDDGSRRARQRRSRWRLANLAP